MSEATATTPFPELSQEPGARIGHAITLFKQCIQVNDESARFVADLIEGRAVPVEAMIMANRIADIGADLRKLADLPDALRDAAFIAAAGLTAPPVAAVPDPAPGRRRSRHRGRHAGDRPLMRVLPSGAFIPAAFGAFRWLKLPGAAAHKAAAVKALVAAGATGAVAVTALSLGSAHTLQYDTRLPSSPSLPSAFAPAVPIRFASSPDPDYDPPAVHGKLPKPKVLAAPVPVPEVTSSPPADPSPSYQDDQSQQSGQSDWSQQSDQSGSSQPSQWDARGQHAGHDSSAGDSRYKPRHGDNSGQSSNYWEHGNGDGSWQGDHGQRDSWQNGNRQDANSQGGGWQGGHGGH